MVYPILKLWFNQLCRIMIKDIKGTENIPDDLNFIIAANHSRLIDPAYIAYPILKKLNRKLHFVASPKWIPILGSTICEKWAGCIPAYNGRTYDQVKNALFDGKIVGIFPEGHLEERVRIPRTGVIRLSAETHIPILPIGVKSSYKPFSSLVSIGKLVYVDKRKNMKKQLQSLMGTIYKLRDGV